MTTFALVIAHNSASLYRLARTSATLVAAAGADDNPITWLAVHLPVNSVCAIVSDSADESYTRSVLPPIWSSGTRQQLLQRRLVQQLRDQRYRAAVLVPSGSFRPPTLASLIGAGQTERIDEWLAALVARHSRIKGLWPLSSLIALAVNTKATRRPRADAATASVTPPSPQPTLALVATPAGLRQVLVMGKTVFFSRLALSPTESSLSAQFVLTEARRTVQYLISHEWLSMGDQPVATQLWLPAADAQVLYDVGTDRALDVQSIQAEPDAYARLLPLLRSAPAQPQFLPDSYLKLYRAVRVTSAAQVVGAAALALAVLWSADLLWQTYGNRQLAQQQVARAALINQQAQQEVQRAKGDLSQAGLAVATVQAWQQTIATQPSQLQAMQHLASALRATPTVELQKIRWELPRLMLKTPAAPAAGAAASTAALACPRVNDGVSTPVAVASPPAAASKPPVAMLNLVMGLPADLDQRQALELQDAMHAALNAGGWAAYITKSSINFDPAQAQLGKLGEAVNRTLELCLEKAAS
jgi:hypothetical protein